MLPVCSGSVMLTVSSCIYVYQDVLRYYCLF